jgi:hypothetical protein
MTERCRTCGHQIHADCNYNQGRCPHTPPMIDIDKFKIYNIIQIIKGWFK